MSAAETTSFLFSTERHFYFRSVREKNTKLTQIVHWSNSNNVKLDWRNGKTYSKNTTKQMIHASLVSYTLENFQTNLATLIFIIAVDR